MDLNNAFHSHAVHGEGLQKMETIRTLAKGLGQMIQSLVPAGREQSLALTNVQQAMFWANAGIAGEYPVTQPTFTRPD